MNISEKRFIFAMELIENSLTYDQQIETLNMLCQLYEVENIIYRTLWINGAVTDELPVLSTCESICINLDKVMETVRRTNLPIDWMSVEQNLSTFGAGCRDRSSLIPKHNVLSIPIHAGYGSALFTFTSSIIDDVEWKDFCRKVTAEFAMVGRYFHEHSILNLKKSITKPLLTPREKLCLQLLAEGNNAVAIGRIIDLSVRTVRMHLRNAQKRLKAKSTTAAVARALTSGELDQSGNITPN